MWAIGRLDRAEHRVKGMEQGALGRPTTPPISLDNTDEVIHVDVPVGQGAAVGADGGGRGVRGQMVRVGGGRGRFRDAVESVRPRGGGRGVCDVRDGFGDRAEERGGLSPAHGQSEG